MLIIWRVFLLAIFVNTLGHSTEIAAENNQDIASIESHDSKGLTGLLNTTKPLPAEQKEQKDTPKAIDPVKLPEEYTPQLSDNVNTSAQHSRNSRQLFYTPNLILLPTIGSEGGKCLSATGLTGYCVRFTNCHPQQRLVRQLSFFTLKQWPFPNAGDKVCSFYDEFGRANTGICCTRQSIFDLTGNGVFAFQTPINNLIPTDGINGGSLTPIQPIPAPPLAPETPPTKIEHDDSETVENSNPATDDESVTDSKQTEMDEEVNNFMHDPIIDYQTPTRQQQFYNDLRYQWASQFPGHYGIQQWPPPIPTHPPSTANWPPPIPTHPPNHHYPTHPPSSSSSTLITTRRPAHTTTTTRRTTSRPLTTTTRRYPHYPPYPSYPTYTTTTTTTTRRPPTTVGTSTNGLPKQCGIKNPSSPDQERIVGGTNASPHEFPWIAVLFKSGKQFCGGSLITNNHILTAAHCVARMTSWDVAAITAHLGDYNIRTDFEVQHVQRRIKRLVRHKGFEFSTLHNDIAVLTLSEPVKFTHEIQPICLPTSTTQQTRSYSGHVATVAGWGSLRENGPQPSILQKVQIPIWTNNECARKYGRAAPAGIIESMICAGQAAKDSCSGDSGGPLIVQENGRYTQVGIVSWGIGCGKGEYPGVYTRVTSLLPWVYKNIK